MAGGLQEDDGDELHEINVTPFIDVMLVLLIIFMVAAPLSTVDVPVELPGASLPAAQRPDQPLIVTLVQTNRRLVQNVQHTHQTRSNLRCEPDALSLATTQADCTAG